MAYVDKNQKYFPEFGYLEPVRMRGVKECESPAFVDKTLHRIGVCKVRFDADGLPGWICEEKCVNCGRVVRKVFVPSVE